MRWMGVAAACVVLGLAGQARAEVTVTISKSQQKMAVAIDGTEAYRWPISTGRRGFETPTGKFKFFRLERHWYSRQYELTPMPWSSFFFRGYAVHGTMEASNLGKAASHGCVRLRPDNAALLFALVRKHGFNKTRVVVNDAPLPGTAPTRDRGFETFRGPQARALPDEPKAHARALETKEDVATKTRARPEQPTRTMPARPGTQREAELRRTYQKYGFKW